MCGGSKRYSNPRRARQSLRVAQKLYGSKYAKTVAQRHGVNSKGMKTNGRSSTSNRGRTTNRSTSTNRSRTSLTGRIRQFVRRAGERARSRLLGNPTNRTSVPGRRTQSTSRTASRTTRR